MLKWKSLPKEVQEFLTQEAKVLENQMWENSPREHAQGLACLTGDGNCPEGKPANMVKVEVKDADIQKLKEIFPSKIVPRWTKACGTDCVRSWNDTVGKRVGIIAPVP